MNDRFYVAYNFSGDLVAEGCTYGQVVLNAAWAGYAEEELIVGVVAAA